jgi:acetate kinase
MQDLLAAERNNPAAAEAIAVFCYQVAKYIGAFTATLGGLDTLVFAGGIGENAPPIRQRICGGLTVLGICLDTAANGRNADVISSPDSRVAVRVIRTNEELIVARHARDVLSAAR